jgi:hypothetical protein
MGFGLQAFLEARGVDAFFNSRPLFLLACAGLLLGAPGLLAILWGLGGLLEAEGGIAPRSSREQNVISPRTAAT